MAGEDGRDLETPVLQELNENRVERVSVPEVLKRQPKRILLTVPAATARTGTGIPGWHDHLHLWHHRAGNDTRFPVGRCAPADRAGFHAGYYRGPAVGRDRPQAGVHERLHDHGDLRLRVLRVAGDPDPVSKFRCRGDLAYSDQELVWT